MSANRDFHNKLTYNETFGDDDYLIDYKKQKTDRENLNFIPTNDDVRAKLRELSLPPELPNESRLDRRERLASYITLEAPAIGGTNIYEKFDDGSTVTSEAPVRTAVEKTGGQELLDFRQRLSAYALNRISVLTKQKREEYDLFVSDRTGFLSQVVTDRRNCNQRLAKFSLFGTQSGFERPVSGVRFFRNQIVASDLSGKIALLDSEMEYLKVISIAGTTLDTAVGTVSGRPVSKLAAYESDYVNLIAAGSTNSCYVLNEHLDIVGGVKTAGRVQALELHPKYMVAAVNNEFDITDLETMTTVLNQNGHLNTLNDVKPSIDTSLLLTCSSDCTTKLWDLRMSQDALTVQSPAENLKCAWRAKKPHEFYVAGSDHAVNVWDVRQPKDVASTIYAHTEDITGLDISADDNNMVTCGMDNLVRIWCLDTSRLLNEFKTQRPVCVDFKDEILVGKYNKNIDLYNLT